MYGLRGMSLTVASVCKRCGPGQRGSAVTFRDDVVLTSEPLGVLCVLVIEHTWLRNTLMTRPRVMPATGKRPSALCCRQLSSRKRLRKLHTYAARFQAITDGFDVV